MRTVNSGSFGRERYPIAKNACRAIGCFSSSYFHVATCHGEDSKDRVPHELNDRQSDAAKHMLNSACQTKKKVVPAFGLWQAMKSESIFRILNARNLELIPPTINISLKTKSLRTENDAVLLMGSGGCYLLRAVKTCWNC